MAKWKVRYGREIAIHQNYLGDKMAKRNKQTKKPIEQYDHKDKKHLKNPPVGLVSTATDKLNGRTKYEHDPHIDPTLLCAEKKRGVAV